MATNMSRGAGNIVIVVRDSDSPPLPYELQNHVSTETWDFRMRQVRRLCNQYSKPMLERIWFTIAFLTTFILPIALYNVIFNAITPASVRSGFDASFGNFNGTRPDGHFNNNEIAKYYLEARGILLGVFVGLVLVFWGPLVAWKRIGSIKANAMTNRWKAEDASRGSSGFIPAWRIRTPGVFSILGRVFITTPQVYTAPQMSFFAPGATGNLPAYIIQPAQNGAPAGGYFYNPGNGGQMYMPPPPMGAPGTGYTGQRSESPEGERPMLVDEKYREHFDDVKV